MFDTGATNFFLIVPTLTVPTVGFFLKSKAVKNVNKREVKWLLSFFESEQVRPFLYIASCYALAGMGGQVEVHFRVGLSSLS